MAISDDPTYRQRKTPKRRSPGSTNKRWSDSQKVEAVQTYMILGSLNMVAGTLQIPFDTLKVWKQSEWWKNMLEELRIQEDLQLSTRLRKIVEKSYDVVEDRLENGDFVYDQKTGKMRRKPVSMRDAHKVAMDAAEKKEHLIDRHMDNQTVSVDKIEKRLAELAESFARIASTSKTGPIEVTDVVFGKIEGEDSDAT
jgi:transposase-like protein